MRHLCVGGGVWVCVCRGGVWVWVCRGDVCMCMCRGDVFAGVVCGCLYTLTVHTYIILLYYQGCGMV